MLYAYVNIIDLSPLSPLSPLSSLVPTYAKELHNRPPKGPQAEELKEHVRDDAGDEMMAEEGGSE